MIIPFSSHPHHHTHSSNIRPYSSSPTSHTPIPPQDSRSIGGAAGVASSYPSSSSHPISSPQLALFKRRMKSTDTERHSMDLDNKVNEIDLDSGFRTRSKTVSDLNEASMDESGGFVPGTLEPATTEKNKENSSCSSSSNLSCSSQTGSQSGSAKLQYASADPLHYSSSSASSADRAGASSPVWKRAEIKLRPGQEQEDGHSTRSGGDSSNNSAESIPPVRRDTKTVVFAPVPGGVPLLKDTEC